MKLKLTILVSLLAFGFALNANAGAVTDGDSDLVPDSFDNCSSLANGPGETSNQVDSDQDGYGNACDTDYNNDGMTTTTDFASFFLPAFTLTTPNPSTDHNGDGLTTTVDFTTFLAQFQSPPGAPGPSGLGCAGTVPCLP